MSQYLFSVCSFVLFLAGCAPQTNLHAMRTDGSFIHIARMGAAARERNQALLTVMAQHGDDCSRPRLIRHFVTGPIEKLQLLKASLPRGTRTELQTDPSNLIFSSFGRCSVEILTRRGEEISRLVRPFNLTYDGWDVDHKPR
jgi:hypothetical protein